MPATGVISAKVCGVDPLTGYFSFQPNGASNPVISGSSSTLKGGAKRYVSSITYSATGVLTIVFTSDFVFPGEIQWSVSNHYDSGGTQWYPALKGAYTTATRTLVLQCTNATNGANIQVPANANNIVRVFFEADLSAVAT
jgi:hypothetical protein